LTINNEEKYLENEVNADNQLCQRFEPHRQCEPHGQEKLGNEKMRKLANVEGLRSSEGNGGIRKVELSWKVKNEL